MPDDLSTAGTPDPTGFTWRSILLGMFLSLVIGCGAPYATLYQVSSFLFLDYSTAGATFLLFVVVLVFNLAVGRVLPPAKLNRAELSLIAVMMIVAAALPTAGLTSLLLPAMAAPHYYYRSEPWATVVEPHVWDATVPIDTSAYGPERYRAVKHFFEGLPTTVEDPGEVLRQVPWDLWLGPLLVWGIFLAALYAVMVTTMVLARKQWIENERLIFPIAQVPVSLIRSADPEAGEKPIWRSVALWIGVGIPVVLTTLRALPRYIEHFPTALVPGHMRTQVDLFQGLLGIPLYISLPMIGFAFLISRSVAFSVWFFSVLSIVQIGLFRQWDIKLDEHLGFYGAGRFPILAHLGTGALLMLVVVGVWVARRHLWNVLRKAFRGDADVDDSREIMSYRTAVVLWLWGMATMVVWVRLAGLPLPYAALFIFLAIAIFLGLTRIVCESGMAVAQAPLIAQSALVSGFGTASIGPAGMAALGSSWSWMGMTRTSVMASTAHGLRVLHETATRRRGIALAIVLAILLAAGASVVSILALTHRYGGLNLIGGWFMTARANMPYIWTFQNLAQQSEPHVGGWVWTGVGATIAIGLLLARRYLLWWPLHPIGLPIAAVNTAFAVWVSVFIAWAVKSVLMKYGGPQLYRRSRPFFIGLILGQFAIAGLWVLIDFVTGTRENHPFLL